jgi:hypothetical protein
MVQETKRRGRSLTVSAQRLGKGLVLSLAKPVVRLLVMLLSVGLLLYFLYTTVWWELQQDVPLPAAIRTEAQVATETLDSIAAERVERVERTPRTFAPFAPFFSATTSTSSP